VAAKIKGVHRLQAREELNCGRECQIEHRPRHKMACKKQADELREEALFRQPPRGEDCPICFLPLPESLSGGGQAYWSCCGKIICGGCVYADSTQNRYGACPFCRAPRPNFSDAFLRLNKRLEVNDPEAFYNIGLLYDYGEGSVVRDKSKALEYYIRGAELGSAMALSVVARAYYVGCDDAIAKDEKKARHYYELAAMKGNNQSRCHLGVEEAKDGKYDKALKHWLISCGRGHHASLENIKHLFMNGNATKEDYGKALRSYQQYIDEVKSDQRDKAAAFDGKFKYRHL
jgi:TPR repeat protein